MNLYYRIWVDCILRLKSIEANKDNWQIKSQIMMTVAMTFNFILIMAILQRNILKVYFYKINIHILSSYENNILGILILFFLPCLIINYLLIFRGKRYEKLVEKYPYHNGKLILIYILISMFFPLILLLGGMILLRFNII